jgi:hypothetical protein
MEHEMGKIWYEQIISNSAYLSRGYRYSDGKALLSTSIVRSHFP